MILVAVILIGITTMGLVWRFAQINDLDYRITKMEQQIATLQQANAGLTVELKKLTSPSRIESRASSELGMQWPTDQQIVNVATELVPAEH